MIKQDKKQKAEIEARGIHSILKEEFSEMNFIPPEVISDSSLFGGGTKIKMFMHIVGSIDYFIEKGYYDETTYTPVMLKVRDPKQFNNIFAEGFSKRSIGFFNKIEKLLANTENIDCINIVLMKI